MKKTYVFMMSALLFSLTGTITGQVSDADRYWIKENFSTFPVDSVSVYIKSTAVYETSPNQVLLQAYYANFEPAEGTCGRDTSISDKHLRIRGLKDNGWASFTVPNADTVIVNLRGKSHAGDRIIRVFRNEVLVETFNNIDEDTCVIFRDIVQSADSVTYKITAGDSTADKPVVIYGIEVSKFVEDGISANFLTESHRISIWPNPVKDILTINANGLKIKSMEIYSMTGQHIISYKDNNGNTSQINTSHLPEGAYLLKINTDSRTLFSKFIKL
ncbi:MAG: T9SS type A sorting domain-containing protein [Bacteroidales bacterium]|jgi:hypothetical protein|nr:T9SS type A sorting domain-containing protein [Bacteroidales bacterium]